MDYKELIFVSGKGGTGKTTVAMTLAKGLSQQGKKVLLVELAQSSSARSLAQLKKQPTYKPTASGLGFDWSLVTGMDCLVEYISSFTKVESLTQKVFESHLIRTLVNVAPGLNDLSILGKLTSAQRGHGPGFFYDHIVVDAPSTGSFLSLIRAPKILGSSVSGGPLKAQCDGIDRILRDDKRVEFFFVSLFEELPMDELEDTLLEFRDDYKSQVQIVMNKDLSAIKKPSRDGDWPEYLRGKLESNEVQGQRAQKLWPPSYSFQFITQPFDRYISSNIEEVLCPL